MFGDPRELVEVNLLAKLAALTTADGLPQNFRLVTREMIHLNDVQAGQLPVAFLQCEEPEMVARLSYVYECTLQARVIVGFAPTTMLPVSVGNAYRLVIERALISDFHLGGLVDGIYLRGHLQPGAWEEVGLLAIGVLFSVLFEYDPRSAAIVA